MKICLKLPDVSKVINRIACIKAIRSLSGTTVTQGKYDFECLERGEEIVFRGDSRRFSADSLEYAGEWVILVRNGFECSPEATNILVDQMNEILENGKRADWRPDSNPVNFRKLVNCIYPQRSYWRIWD